MGCYRFYMQNRFVVPVAILIGGLLIAVAVFFAFKPEPPEDGAIGDPSSMRPVGDDDHILGNPSAPIVFVEYADADCAYCAFQNAALRSLMGSYGASGDVAWVYRHFPLPGEQSAVDPSLALECSASIGGNAAFFDFLTSYSTEPASTTASRLALAAQAAGIDAQALLDCASSSVTKERVARDAADALAAGATAVPYTVLVVKDRPPVGMSGVISAAQLSEMVEAARKGLAD